MAFCSNCGEAINFGVRFCPRCGNEIAPPTNPNQYGNPNQYSNPNRCNPYTNGPVMNAQAWLGSRTHIMVFSLVAGICALLGIFLYMDYLFEMLDKSSDSATTMAIMGVFDVLIYAVPSILIAGYALTYHQPEKRKIFLGICFGLLVAYHVFGFIQILVIGGEATGDIPEAVEDIGVMYIIIIFAIIALESVAIYCAANDFSNKALFIGTFVPAIIFETMLQWISLILLIAGIAGEEYGIAFGTLFRIMGKAFLYVVLFLAASASNNKKRVNVDNSFSQNSFY